MGHGKYLSRVGLLAALSLAIAACGGAAPSGDRSPARAANETPPVTSPLPARITEDAERIALRTNAGHVEIARTPLAMTFFDADGKAVLSTVDANEAGGLLPRLPLPTRVPGGLQTLPDAPALYAPFTFLIGVQLNLQFPATFWAADMLASTATGIEYRLTDVQSVETRDNAVHLRVATSDPSGRMAYVTVRPDDNDSFSVSVRLDPVNQEVPLIAASFASAQGEAFRGFGGRRNKIDQRGEAFLNWAEEFSQLPEQFEPIFGDSFGEQYQFPTGAQGAYYVQSLFVSDQGYGFLLDRDELSHWRMASDRDDAWRVEVAGGALDFLVAPGDVRSAVGKLSGINGRHRVPPRWALGPMLSETNQEFFDTPASYNDKVQDTLDKIEALDLPVSSLFIEGWFGLKEVGTFEAIVQRLRARNIRPVVYFRGFVVSEEDTFEAPEAFQEAIDNGYVARNVLDQPFLFVSPISNGLAGLIDFTNPEAVNWWKGRVTRALEEGAEGFMQDFGEQAFVDMVFADGSTGIAMHNRSAGLYHRATREAFDAFVAENPEREPFFYVRYGNSGRKGSAHFESASWPGDNTADWSRASGIGSVIPDMLNRGIGGAYGFVSEIGGYIDTFGTISPELLIRWANHASLMPIFRQHGGPLLGTPLPWRFDDPEVVEQYRATMQRHIAAQPLIMRLWEQALATGMPIARPLWLQFPDDPEAALQDQQFMLGPDVLVAPIVTEAANSRNVYFPAGCWRHPETGEQVDGPRTQRINAAIDELPYFFRCGTQPFAVPEGGFRQ